MLPQHESELISMQLKTRVFPARETILRPDIQGNEVYFVNKGLILQFLQNENNDRLYLSILGKGDAFGHQQIFEGHVSKTSLMSLNNATLYSLPIPLIARLLKTYTEFSWHFIQCCMDSSNNLIEMLGRRHHKQMAGKLAQTLLYLNDTGKKFHVDVFGMLSRNDLSLFAGISSINVVKLLHNFENEGLIQLNKKSIEILNFKELNHLSTIG